MVALPLLALSLLASTPEGEGWTQVVDKDVKLWVRPIPGKRVQESYAESVLDCPPQEVRDTLMDPEEYNHTPYVAEWRIVSQTSPNVSVKYTRLALPIVDDRDYFIEVTIDDQLDVPGKAYFRNSWKPWGLDQPERKGVVRVTTNEGAWEVRPAAGGLKSAVSYRLLNDPGGNLPSWMINMANKRLIPDVIRALYKNVLRRRAERAEKAKAAQTTAAKTP